MSAQPLETFLVPLEELRLDPQNPRLPEEVQDSTQEEILEYLARQATLEELARSFVDNGYFAHEPLLVEKLDDHYVVLEGNRRLAALKILLQAPEATANGLTLAVDAPIPERAAELSAVPCLWATREEVRKYLGFRHIGGIKTWSAEAKARYLYDDVERTVAQEVENPFADVARRVGSNAQGVRTSYTAMALLRAAREL